MREMSNGFLDLVEDDNFLSHVAAVEETLAASSGAANKRRKLTTIDYRSNAKGSHHGSDGKVVEGAYMAALKGSKSQLWQQQQSNLNVKSNYNSSFQSKVTSDYNGSDGGGVGTGGSEVLIPDKNCPCGLGVCLVLTANTERNRGRKFYKCAVRQESGGCGFFEWCDSGSGTNNAIGSTRSYAPNSSFPDVPCPCGAGSCLVLTAKTGKNLGQQFYRCPAGQGSCGFFKWCNDHRVAAVEPVAASRVYNNNNNMNDSNNSSRGMRTGSACFKCSKEGHWAKDCPS
ncbi:DNA topoisomerase 3-alpha-like [Tripterygium wilfordii]|uniref:DNA topoisomerase 3-alpha-like n=1 Tax=Tripterygium wilfordii TaxID=458696 RepID=UPI0018F847F2|nr:DNA topoisomerase 3-alpha-like [Tripterygium wilfordii]